MAREPLFPVVLLATTGKVMERQISRRRKDPSLAPLI